MIVLGIAALILAGVLIAVPALQRNQRNNNRRADISYVQAQLTAYQGSNQNALPDARDEVRNVLVDEESAYYSANDDWTTQGNWNDIVTVVGTNRLADITVNGAGATVAGDVTTDADEYDLWVDRGNTDANADPGAGTDPLPDEEHFDVFIGYQCQAATLVTPNPANYPGANTFVNENGRARDFAIVYRLEGEGVHRCQDNT